MPGSFDTPNAVIGLELQGKGFDTVANQAKDQLGTWENIERTTGRIGGHMDMIGRSLGTIAAGFSVAKIIGDFAQLEDAASRAALTTGAIGGPSTYGPFRNSLRAAGIATSIDARQLAAGVQGMVGQVGAAGMTTPGQWGGLATSLGNYSRAYGIDVGALAAQGGDLALYQKQGLAAVPGMFGTVAAQANAAGQSAQTAQWLQAVSGVTGQLGAAHPLMTGPGTSQSVGALYGAVSAGNPIFKDPGMFAQGVGGIDSALTNAYSNPRTEAALQMAGIGYWQQRAGLSGKGGAGMAKKLLAYSERHYGKGSVEQDLFLRSQFGDVSTDMLYAFADGKVTYDQLKGVQNGPKTQADIQARSKSSQDTPSARLNRTQQDATSKVDGPLASILDFLGVDNAQDALLLLGGMWGGKKLLGKGSSKVFGALKARAGSSAATSAAATAGGDASAAAAGGAAAAGESVVGEEAGAIAGGARFGPVGAVAGAVIGVLTSKGDLADEDQLDIKRKANILAKKFGPHWISNQKAREYAVKNFQLHAPYNAKKAGIWEQMFDLGGTQSTAQPNPATQGMTVDPTTGAATSTTDRALQKSAKDLSDAAAALKKSAGGGSSDRKGASFDPAGVGGTTSAQVGSNMILARSLTAGGGLAQTEAQMVSYNPGQPSAPGHASGGSSSGGGGDWKDCTLTWYDPALGGINSSHGQADPHSKMANGQPYQAGAMTCAAPPAYAFGTKIDFQYGGKTVTCTVTDRGGAITGAHFDLSRGAAQAVGLIQAGTGKGKFRVAGGSSSSRKSSSKSGGDSIIAPGAHPTDAAWLAGAGASASARASSMRGSGGTVEVHIDGRKTEAMKRLVRG